MPGKLPLIGGQTNVFPKIAVQITPAGVVLDVVESPIKVTRIILEDAIMAQLFVSYGSTCIESTVRDMLKSRAMSLNKIRKEPEIERND